MKKSKHIIWIFFLTLSLFQFGCISTAYRINNEIVRPYELTARDAEFMSVPFLATDAMSRGIAGSFFLVFLADLPFAFIGDTLFLPVDLWNLQYNSKYHKDLIISGKVVDNTGNLLNQVKVIIDANRRENIIYGSENYIKKIDNTFLLKINNVKAASLLFERNGYYNETLSISPNDKKYKDKLRNNILEIKDLKIVMRKIGKLVNLLECGKRLKFTPDGKTTVFSLKQKKNENGDVIDPEISDNFKEDEDDGNLVHVKNIFKSNSLPENCIYLLANCSASGKIKTERIHPDPDDDYYYDIPEGIRLKFTAKESGFIIYNHGKKKSELIWRNMLKAPDKNYEKEIRLNANEIEKTVKHGDGLYFYFTANGKYGKGSIKNLQLEDETLEIDIQLYMNPAKGDRNLESINN